MTTTTNVAQVTKELVTLTCYKVLRSNDLERPEENQEISIRITVIRIRFELGISRTQVATVTMELTSLSYCSSIIHTDPTPSTENSTTWRKIPFDLKL